MKIIKIIHLQVQNKVSFKKHVHVRMACLLEAFDAQ